MTSKYKEYLKSKEWAEIRQDLFLVRGKKCEMCQSVKNLHIHHLTYERIFNEEPSDLQILCKRCHEKEHGINVIKKKAVKKTMSLAQKVAMKNRHKKQSKLTKRERDWIKSIRKQKRKK